MILALILNKYTKCVSSNSNIVFPHKLCNTNIKDKIIKDSAVQYDICQFWIHAKCNNLNHIHYQYLQESNDPWLSISCYTEIFLFVILTNENFLSLMMVNSQGLIQVVFNIGIPILGILIWVCPNLIIGKVKITKQCNSCFNFSVHIVDINLNKKKKQ